MKNIKFPELMSVLFIFILGVASISISLIDLFEFTLFTSEMDFLKFISAILGTILLAIGIERITILSRQDGRSLEIMKLAMKSIDCVWEDGYDNIIDLGNEKCKTAKKEIRTLAVGSTHTAPLDWSKSIAIRLADSLAEGKPVYFTSVTILNPNSDIKGFIDGMEKRHKIYEKHDVLKLVDHHVIETSFIGYQLLIVDNNFVAMGIPRGKEIKNPNRAIIFYEKQELVESFSDWHKLVLMNTPGIKPYIEWKKGKNLQPNPRSTRQPATFSY